MRAASREARGGHKTLSPWGWHSPAPVFAIAAAMLVAALWLWPDLTPGGQIVDESEADIADWVAPSAALLHLDEGELLDLAPGAYSAARRRRVADWALPSDTLMRAAEKAADQENDL